MEDTEVCIQDCLHRENPNDGDRIRCILCCVWHHIDCVSVLKKEIKAVWTCHKCRQIAKTVKEMNAILSDMQLTQNSMLELIHNMKDKITTETELRKKAETELAAVVEELSEANKKIQSLSNAEINDDPLPMPIVPPKPSLLLGTSLLRNVNEQKIEHFEVMAKGGASLNDLNVALSALPNDKSYEKIIIVGGSIDIESKSPKDVTDDFQALAVSATLRADKTVICSIPPRTDKDLSTEIHATNISVQEMTNAEGIGYVDLDELFLLKNGSVNKPLLHSDGLHLSKHGVDNLIAACEVKLKDESDSAYSEARYKQNKPVYFKGHTHPLSNFYPLKNFVFEGIRFATSEAAYVFRKALYHNDHRTAASVKQSRTGIHAKRLGDKIKTVDSWQTAKVDIMDDIIRAKLANCEDARSALLATNDREIIEDTENKFWGKGSNNDGLNMLGEMWTMYRRKLKMDSLPRRRQWATRNNQPKCYRCGEPGHLLEACRKTENVACWNCGKLGHKQKHCRRYASQH